jgi:hypothetical protein
MPIAVRARRECTPSAGRSSNVHPSTMQALIDGAKANDEPLSEFVEAVGVVSKISPC